MAVGQYNIIRFVPYAQIAGGGRYVPTPERQNAYVYLAMDGEFTLSPGVSANVNAFSTPWTEYDKLGGNPDRSGRLEFFYNADPRLPQYAEAAPDCVIEWISIVDVEAVSFGRPLMANGTVGAYRIVGYRLFVADRRHRFAFPRGGVLRKGKLNATGTTDPYTNRELIEMCLDAMGVRDHCEINGDPDAKAQVWDIEWRGNHAPEELDKILKELDWVMVVRLDGTLSLEPRGDGAVPVLPSAQSLPEIVAPGIERKGTIVVFSSAPNAIIRTETITGPSPTTWEFVGLDDDRKWKPLSELSCLGNSDAARLVRGEDVYPYTAWAWTIADGLFRYIRLNPTLYPGRTLSRVLRDGRREPLIIEAMAAVAGSDGGWRNSNDWVQFPATFVHAASDETRKEESVIEVGQRLGRTDLDGALTLDPHFTELSTGQLRARVSYEASKLAADGTPDLDEKGNAIPRYFEVGFTRDTQGQIVQLTAPELEAAMLDPDTMIISRPDWIDIEVDGESTLGAEMTRVAKGTAELYLRGTGKPTILSAVGFCNCIVSGRVTELRISQKPPRTTLKLDHWNLPSEAMRAERWKKGLKDSGKFPKQSQVASERQTLSASGSPEVTQPLLPRASGGSSGSGIALAYGIATADWTSGNSVTLTPCTGTTRATAVAIAGAAEVACQIVWPAEAEPKNVQIKAGDVLAYLPMGSNAGSLMPVQLGGYTELRYNDTTHAFEGRIGEGDWTAWAAMVEQTVVYTVVDDGDEVYQTQGRLWVPQASTGEDATIFEWTDCSEGGA